MNTHSYRFFRQALRKVRSELDTHNTWMMQGVNEVNELVRDYETTESSAQAWIYIAMIRIQLRRLA